MTVDSTSSFIYFIFVEVLIFVSSSSLFFVNKLRASRLPAKTGKTRDLFLNY